MATIGDPIQGASRAGAMNAEQKLAEQRTPTESGILVGGYADLESIGPNVQATRFGVYADASGAPGVLLGYSYDVLMAPGAARVWLPYTLVSPVALVAGVPIWLTLAFGPAGGSIAYWWDPAETGVAYRWAVDTWVDGFSSSFGTFVGTPNVPVMYGVYTPTASILPLGLRRVRNFAGATR